MPTAQYHDASLPSEVRADLLLQELTLEEKCHQLTSVMPWSVVRPDGSDADSDSVDELLRHPPGHVAQLIVDDRPDSRTWSARSSSDS